MRNRIACSFAVVYGLVSSAALAAGTLHTSIQPGEIWTDNRGKHIQAHGGGIVKEGDTYYWFGEDRGAETGGWRGGAVDRAVACYSSKDLMNWTFRRQVVHGGPPEQLPSRGYILERPKVYHNAKTGKYVLYAHLDSGRYTYARVAVYVCDTVDGDYKFVHSFRPLDKESRDIGQFVDDDGSAYLIFESRPTKGFYIAQLSNDYLTVAKETCFIRKPLEGGAVVHLGDLYYVIGSYMTGFSPNANQYATAKSLAGPWSEFKDIAPPETKTYGSQSTMLLKVAGTKKTTVIFMGDIWRPRQQSDSRYLWMPLEIGDGKLFLPKPAPWKIDIHTGDTTGADH
jgi:beta-xylosidase